jgi:cell division septation protein DedD
VKDYARKQRSPATPVSPEVRPAFRFQWTRTWTYIAVAVLLVLVLSAVGYWKVTHKAGGASAEKTLDAKKSSKSKAKSSLTESPREPSVLAKPQFEFYDILPERESAPPALPTPSKPSPSVVVVTATPSAPSAQPQSTAPVSGVKKQFVIQVASYQEKAQAQKVVQRLRQAQIQARLILTPSGWWRVDVGPIETRKDAESIRHNIQNQGIVGSLIREVPKP